MTVSGRFFVSLMFSGLKIVENGINVMLNEFKVATVFLTNLKTCIFAS